MYVHLCNNLGVLVLTISVKVHKFPPISIHMYINMYEIMYLRMKCLVWEWFELLALVPRPYHGFQCCMKILRKKKFSKVNFSFFYLLQCKSHVSISHIINVHIENTSHKCLLYEIISFFTGV